MNQTFIILTRSGPSLEIDTIITGPEAAEAAFQHRFKLVGMGFEPLDVIVWLTEGDYHSEAAQELEDLVAAGRPVGSKAFQRIAEQTGAKVGLARFLRSAITAEVR